MSVEKRYGSSIARAASGELFVKYHRRTSVAIIRSVFLFFVVAVNCRLLKTTSSSLLGHNGAIRGHEGTRILAQWSGHVRSAGDARRAAAGGRERALRKKREKKKKSDIIGIRSLKPMSGTPILPTPARFAHEKWGQSAAATRAGGSTRRSRLDLRRRPGMMGSYARTMRGGTRRFTSSTEWNCSGCVVRNIGPSPARRLRNQGAQIGV